MTPHHIGWALVPVAIGAFLVGSIPFGVLVGRWFYDSDIRNAGSGNIGAANAFRSYGRTAGFAVLVLDALKGALPTVIELQVGGDGAAAVAALFAMLGHCYSPWLNARGGKGVATWFGALFVLSAIAGVTFALVWVAVVAVRRFASLGSLAATVVSAAVLIYLYHHIVAIDLAAAVATIVIVVKHRFNIGRLRAGTEPHLRFRRSRAAAATGPPEASG